MNIKEFTKLFKNCNPHIRDSYTAIGFAIGFIFWIESLPIVVKLLVRL